MTACVAWETALRDNQENVSTGQTHRQTDGQTDTRQSFPYVPLYASQATQKPQHLKKKNDCSSDLFGYSEFRGNLFSANALYIYMVIFLDWPVTPQ